MNTTSTVFFLESSLHHETCWDLSVRTSFPRLYYRKKMFLSLSLSAAVIQNSAHNLVLKIKQACYCARVLHQMYEYISVEEDRSLFKHLLRSRLIFEWWESFYHFLWRIKCDLAQYHSIKSTVSEISHYLIYSALHLLLLLTVIDYLNCCNKMQQKFKKYPQMKK